MHKGQGRRPLWDAHGLRALRWHCFTHWHDSVIDITKWAQEYFQKQLSVNTICHAICRCQALSCKKEAIWEHGPEKQSCPVGQELIWNWLFHQKCAMVRRVPIWHSCWKARAKEEGELPVCYQRSVQKPASLMVWGCISAYVMDSLHVLKATMNAERYIKVLEQHMLPSRLRVLLKNNEKPHNEAITTAWLHSRRVRVLNWPACSPELSPVENSWRIIKRNIWKMTTNSSAAGNIYQARMGQNSNTKTPKTHNLDVQTFSNCFEKKRRCYTMVNMPCRNYFETCSRHQIGNELILWIQFKNVC